MHARAIAAVSKFSKVLERRLHEPQRPLSEQAPRVWCEQLRKVAFDWGPLFAILQQVFTNRARKFPLALAKVSLLQKEAFDSDIDAKYLIQSITMDDILQTALIAVARGSVENLRGKLPTAFKRIRIASFASIVEQRDKICSTQASVEPVGVGNIIANCELLDSQSRTLVQVEDVWSADFERRARGEDKGTRSPLVHIE